MAQIGTDFVVVFNDGDLYGHLVSFQCANHARILGSFAIYIYSYEHTSAAATQFRVAARLNGVEMFTQVPLPSLLEISIWPPNSVIRLRIFPKPLPWRPEAGNPMSKPQPLS